MIRPTKGGFFYSFNETLFSKLGLHLPLSSFEKEILLMLNVTPANCIPIVGPLLRLMALYLLSSLRLASSRL